MPDASAPQKQIAQFRSDGITGVTGLRIPFFTDAFSRASGFPELRLVNYITEATPNREERPYVAFVGLREIRYSRPGIVATGYNFGTGPVRMILAEGVYGQSLVIVSGGAAYGAAGYGLGAIAGTDMARAAVSRTQIVVVGGGVAHLFDGMTFNAIPNTIMPPIADVAFLAGRFIYVCQDSDRFYWSEVEDAANIDPLNFATNELAADNTLGVAVLNNQLVFFGETSVEFWSPNTGAGPTDPAFVPNLGSSYQRGCASRDTICFADNSLFWVGDNRVVYRVGNVPTRISSSSIEDKLRQCADIAGCTAFVVTFEGHEIYVLNVPGVGSYAYDISRIGTTAGAYGDSYERGEWSEWTSFGRTTFRGRCAVVFEGQALIGDDTTNQIGAMQVGTWSDYGAPIERVASAFIKIEEGAPRCDALVLHAVMGVGNAVDPGSEPVAEIRWSDDQGRTFGAWRAASLGAEGRYRNRACWRRLGLMRAPGRLVEVRITDPVDAAISHLELNPARPGQ